MLQYTTYSLSSAAAADKSPLLTALLICSSVIVTQLLVGLWTPYVIVIVMCVIVYVASDGSLGDIWWRAQ